jgi:hypothetical protein
MNDTADSVNVVYRLCIEFFKSLALTKATFQRELFSVCGDMLDACFVAPFIFRPNCSVVFALALVVERF